MGLSRRRFLGGIAAFGAVAAAGAVAARTAARPGRRRKVLTATATSAGEYLYLPFSVPRGVNRIDVKLSKDREETKVGVGLFDERGPGYESAGFRGVFGEESSEFSVSAGRATRSFTPGRIRPGEWTVIVPVFRAAGPTNIGVRVLMFFGKEGDSRRPGPEVGVVNDEPGWYKGELHCHTPQSSDAWASGSSLTPEGWAAKAREIGLDFVSLTDHNVTKQNRNLREAAGRGVLLMAGEEMTNWFHGHATVAGLSPGDHLDWRQRPAAGEFATELGPHEERIQRFVAEARRLGAYTSAAHPAAPLPGLTWQFFADAEQDPEGALTDGMEVWTGPFQPDDEATLKKWDDFLLRGWKVWGNGGSDTHGIKNSGGFAPGEPTNVVYADALSKEGIVAALKGGRTFVTRAPDGAEVYLSATGPGGQRQIVGGTVYGGPADTAEFGALVRGGAGSVLVFVRDGAVVATVPVTSEEQRVTSRDNPALNQPVGATGGYVRVELRDQAKVDPTNPAAGRGAMEALTNPIFLVNGPEPSDNEPAEAPPNP